MELYVVTRKVMVVTENGRNPYDETEKRLIFLTEKSARKYINEKLDILKNYGLIITSKNSARKGFITDDMHLIYRFDIERCEFRI